MPTVTISVDDELKEQMSKHPEINWSEVARTAFEEKIEDQGIIKRLSSDNELTEEDVDELAKRIDTTVAEQLVDR